MSNEKIIQNLIHSHHITKKDLDKAKRQFCDSKKIISNVNLLKTYRQLIKNKKIQSNKNLEKLLVCRPVRTLSGVAIITVLTKPYPCPGKCLYCPQEKNMPKSYLSNEPAVMRAILCQFDPYKQVQGRLKSLYQTGHPTDKIELIILGATWSAYPRQYQTWFIKRCFQAANDFNKRNQPLKQSLSQAQKINQTTQHRIIGLSIETRPNLVNEKEVIRLRKLGCTRIEIGVQTIFNDILQKNKRGHQVQATIQATKLLKQAGFKICYHMMPNLPSSTLKKDLAMFKKLFSSPDFQPDMLKIYPCTVVKGSPLYKIWQQNKYKPYTQKQLIDLLIKIKLILPPYTRVNRLIRDIPSISIEAGNKVTNLREIIQKKMAQQNLACQCIRCREIKNEQINFKNVKFKIIQYSASGGIEYFLSYEDVKNNKLLAFLRLRLPEKKFNPFLQNLNLIDCALVRELHTYGQLINLNSKNKQASQHKGWGKKLMIQAEKITQKNNYSKLAVIAGIGVREYYRKLGYKLDGTYMVKNV
ncbi:MAG: tRNA uridine(34) 5-carboxymethylaminomethyl modification radical SAM/GNAT enzyme Elp3 [Patescibacteria group bacterium]|nr:tRNA uridine(34) 5-carboxymethylaminomethyl modification radical SAM/GNAT enzyme Elp3 [Patescibacteria group bacterium]